MPAEWSRHSATQLHWPSNRKTWPGERLERVEEVYCRIIEELHFFEPIHLFVESLEIRNRVMQKLSGRAVDLDRVMIHQQKINDIWARDCGPIFVQYESGDFIIVDWEYNVWGEKYPPWEDDNRIPSFIADKFGVKRVEQDMILEGGSIDVNGEGGLLATESVLLNKNRNPDLSREEIEERLRTYLGVDQIIWLKRGLEGDDTDGHVDNITRWLNKDTVLTMICEDKEDINYHALQENLETLRKVELKSGKKLNIETLPLLHTKIQGTTVDGSEYVPASYASFYIANGAVLLPLYDKRYDDQAINLLQKYFPGRKIIGIDCADLLRGGGSIHCITQQWYGIN
ncbi:agmatine deiminase family protein [Gracilimonas sp. BCB1]|uniref:agmatine deiminase family protein n=1 Tax=Gracilimonas sp. BCB1 TaxID=3152362 RepID=UPI0032D96094